MAGNPNNFVNLLFIKFSLCFHEKRIYCKPVKFWFRGRSLATSHQTMRRWKGMTTIDMASVSTVKGSRTELTGLLTTRDEELLER